MLPSLTILRQQLDELISCKFAQGHKVAGLRLELERTPDSYDAMNALEERISAAPLRDDWAYEEPNDLAQIHAASDPTRATGRVGSIPLAEAMEKTRAAFEGAICGCMLGKPLEVHGTLDEFHAAATAVGDWPINDYISEDLLQALGRRHPDSWETTRGNITYVAPDDDVNYLVLNLLILEQRGLAFTRRHLAELWCRQLAPLATYGPERTFLIKAATASLSRGEMLAGQEPTDRWPIEDFPARWNPRDEACGAAIRVDGYGYACPGNPALAAELAWREAGMTHNRTGIYGAMFVAAAIATAYTAEDPMAIFREALKHVPQKSRFHEIVSDGFDMVRRATDWLGGYRAIHEKYGQYGHCMVYQESALLINSAKFATSVSDGFCKQVASGADTDCYGKIIGSILGAYYGPGHMGPRWMDPFQDRLHTGLAQFHEQDLSAVTERMSQLPKWTLT